MLHSIFYLQCSSPGTRPVERTRGRPGVAFCFLDSADLAILCQSCCIKNTQRCARAVGEGGWVGKPGQHIDCVQQSCNFALTVRSKKRNREWEREKEEAEEVLGSKMQWIVKFSIVFQCNSVKRNAADADRWIAAVSQPHDSRLCERESAKMSERARREGRKRPVVALFFRKRDTFTAFRSSLQLIVLLERFVEGTHTLTQTQSLSSVPHSPHYPDYLQLKLFSPYYISVSNPKMLENFCTTSVRTLHLLKTRTDEIEKPCPRDDVGVQRRGEGGREC